MAFIASRVHCMPLTPYLFLGLLPDNPHRNSLVHTCAALRQGMQTLKLHYEVASGGRQQDVIPYPLLRTDRWGRRGGTVKLIICHSPVGGIPDVHLLRQPVCMSHDSLNAVGIARTISQH